MQQPHVHSGFILFSMLMLIIPLIASSQTDTLKHDPAKSRHELDAGIGYGSNMIYMGTTISHNLPLDIPH